MAEESSRSEMGAGGRLQSKEAEAIQVIGFERRSSYIFIISKIVFLGLEDSSVVRTT